MNQFERGEVASLEDWEGRRRVALEGMQEVAGALPGDDRRCDLDVRVEEEVDCDSFVRQLLTYASEPGCRTPAYLCVPKEALAGNTGCVGVLCLHGTDHRIGHGTVVGLDPAKEHARYAIELADRGFVTLAPAYPLMAQYQPDIKALGYVSGTMKAVWDNMRGLDLLTELDYVEDERGFGAVGHSLGGHNSVYTAAFEPRLKAVVSNCGLDAFVDYKGGDLTAWTQERYMPRIGSYERGQVPFDFHDLIGAIAPRPCLVIAPYGDDNFGWRSVDQVAAAARQVYALHGVAGLLQVEHPDCGHDFPEAWRQRAYGFLQEHL